jgi:transposase InsO family protein
MMETNASKRLKWVQLYEQIQNAGVVCLKCGISRPTLRKWLRRYHEFGIDGLKDQSKRPMHIPIRKVGVDEEGRILDLRKKRKLGARRIQSELIRNYDFHIALSTIHKVLKRNNLSTMDRKVTRRKGKKRYNRPVPGDRVQMDVMKIAPGIYQYTAIDDCTRYKVLGLYPRRAAKNSLDFLDKVLEEMPFPIQRIQTDRGGEFLAYKFQEELMKNHIKFRPIRPFSPYLNGKVERTQKTDLEEFYSTVDLSNPQLPQLLEQWQDYYNAERPHSSIANCTPQERWHDLCLKIPFYEEVWDGYNPAKERIHIQRYSTDLTTRELSCK